MVIYMKIKVGVSLRHIHLTEEDYNFVVETQKMVLNKIKDKNV